MTVLWKHSEAKGNNRFSGSARVDGELVAVPREVLVGLFGQMYEKFVSSVVPLNAGLDWVDLEFGMNFSAGYLELAITKKGVGNRQPKGSVRLFTMNCRQVWYDACAVKNDYNDPAFQAEIDAGQSLYFDMYLRAFFELTAPDRSEIYGKIVRCPCVGTHRVLVGTLGSKDVRKLC